MGLKNETQKKGSKQIGEILVGGRIRKFRIDSFLNHDPVRLDFRVHFKRIDAISPFFPIGVMFLFLHGSSNCCKVRGYPQVSQ